MQCALCSNFVSVCELNFRNTKDIIHKENTSEIMYVNCYSNDVKFLNVATHSISVKL